MRPLVSLRPAAVVLGALVAASFLFVVTPMARADCGTASSPCPSPTPTPVNAFLSLDVTAGGPNTQITVNGGAFLPNEQMTLYWDQASKVAGGAVADSSGNFVTHVKPFAGDPPGLHRLCASVQPNPCANFTIEAPAPTPPPSPTPSPSPTPTPQVASGVPVNSYPTGPTLSGLEVITRPPFVFLPLTGAFAIAVSFIYWLVSVLRRPRRLKPIPTAAVVHRATRPDYSAGFGAPPAAPAASAEESAWAEPMPQAATPAPSTSEPAERSQPPEPAQPPEPPQPPEPAGPAWGPGEPDSGYPELSPPAEPTEWDLPGPGD